MSGNPLPLLLLSEGVLKVIGGSVFLFSPTTILKNLQSAPCTATSISLIRNLGTQTLAFSIPLFLAARNDVVSIKSRRLVYWTLLGREGLLALGLLGQIGWSHVGQWKSPVDKGAEERERLLEEGLGYDLKGRDEDVRWDERVLRKGLLLWVAELTPFILGRIWILTMKKDWFV
ncbi:hypothetical protein BU24DRAFT_423736 [Aaosphaeria arxii CBS 175.79]|uniref:Uncharacterized protein n=1 Tax=Aaosphaeria arxii CBS 175.79 TaxID=1450172 RepID=A0A6A5XQ20_9PLEO|nr:uncharacterized protein BU24DRAFT_423736 [Aaosphaeria arxii CBS 175.79]KAF2014820.1 hypothetical protein BU24DRAFT_423736 [Aaosphaeria arxii CBS 175.79]